MDAAAGKKRKIKIVLLVTAVLLVCAAAAVLLGTRRVGSRLYRRAEILDAREDRLSREDYDAAAARDPDALIRWSIPIGDERFDSFSEAITLASLPEEDVALLAYFPYLKSIDASACGDYSALAAAARLLPEVKIRWSIPCPDGLVDGNSEGLSVKACGYDELCELTELLPRLKRLDLRASSLSAEQIDALADAHPELAIRYTLRFWGMELSSDSRSLVLDDGAEGPTGELADALARLTELQRADLRGAAISVAELEELLPLCPEDTRYAVPLCGLRFDSDSEEIDLSGRSVGDLAALERAIALLPRLEKVVMSDCGVPDAQMDALDRKYADVRFVWTVHFSVYSLRTDATVFCASDLPGYVAPAATGEELAPLRYCTDLVALDLGHMFFSDLSFLEGLTKLRYLILVEERFSDISVLGTMEELEYLELFNNTIDDISPLLNCRKLRHLNLGYTRGYDPSPLWEMTWLERLWYPGNRMSVEERGSLKAALPDTRCYLPGYDEDGSTGGGWRTDAAYFEMRNVFGMFYQPGGTGTEKQK